MILLILIFSLETHTVIPTYVILFCSPLLFMMYLILFINNFKSTRKMIVDDIFIRSLKPRTCIHYIVLLIIWAKQEIDRDRKFRPHHIVLKYKTLYLPLNIYLLSSVVQEKQYYKKKNYIRIFSMKYSII